MNKKQKNLTVIALVIFVIIVALNYIPNGQSVWVGSRAKGFHHPAIIEHPGLPLFALAVIFAGCFAMTQKTKQP